jgi:two-component system sensor histidine kinase VicK
MAVMFLFIICLMIMVGTILISTIEDTYSNGFAADMQQFENDLVKSDIISDDILIDDETEYANQLFRVFKMYFQIDDTTKKGYLLSPVGDIILPENKSLLSEPIEITDNIILAMSGNIGNNSTIDKDYFDYAKPVIIKGEVKYICYLKQGKDTINEIIASLKKSIVYVVVVALLVSMFVSFILAKAITIPVDKLTKSAEKMANGDFSLIKEPKSGDEISLLASKFNYMGGRLKTTLNEISQEKGKLEALLQNMSDGVIAFDENGELIHANPSGQEFLSISGETMKFNEIFSNIGINVSFEDIMHANQGSSISQKFEVNDKFLNLLFARVFGGNNDSITGIIVVIQDVTEQENLEKMRKEFVANVSHELKTPITSIRGYSETLLEDKEIDKETSSKFLEVINKEAERMARLVSDLLKLSKMDFQNNVVNRASFNVVKMASNCIDKIIIEAEKKQQELVLFNDDEEIFAYANESDIDQVLLNIISNAIKYTPEKGKIAVKVEQIGDNVEILVKDNGIGIPKEDLPRIFERFYRVDKARSREMGGTGLGLSIAKTMIDANGGTIKIDSDVGKGTEVRIRLRISN